MINYFPLGGRTLVFDCVGGGVLAPAGIGIFNVVCGILPSLAMPFLLRLKEVMTSSQLERFCLAGRQ